MGMVEKMTYKRLSEKQILFREREVIRLYKLNYPIPQIMKKVDLGKSMVNIILKKYKVPRTRLPRIPLEKQLKVVELYKEGLTYPAISNLTKVRREMIYIILRRYKVPRNRRAVTWSNNSKGPKINQSPEKLKSFIKNVWGDLENKGGNSNE